MKFFDHEKEKWLTDLKFKCQTFRNRFSKKKDFDPMEIDSFFNQTVTLLWDALLKFRKPQKGDIVLVQSTFERNIGETFYAATVIRRITKGKLSEILLKISQLILFEKPVIIGKATKSDRTSKILDVLDNAGLIAVEIL